jgi:hypothetical protein
MLLPSHCSLRSQARSWRNESDRSEFAILRKHVQMHCERLPLDQLELILTTNRVEFIFQTCAQLAEKLNVRVRIFVRQESNR